MTPRSALAFRQALLPLALLTAAQPARATFTDVTGASGLTGESQSWGAQAVDIDGDDDVDLVLGHHALDVNVLTNDGAGGFSTAGIPQIVVAGEDRHGLLWADLDGDGALDAVCSHGGGGGCGCPAGGNELWRSLGGGNLMEVANAGGMLDAVGRGRSFSAADVDGDGDVDLHHAKAPLLASLNSLYRNDGDMAFADVAAAWGVDEGEGTVGGLFADVDDDGDPDLLVGGEEFGRSTVLWRNDGGTFADATADLFGGPLPVIASDGRAVRLLRFVNAQKLLVLRGDSIETWNVQTEQSVSFKIDVELDGSVTAAASPDASRVVIGADESSSLYVFDVASGKLEFELRED